MFYAMAGKFSLTATKSSFLRSLPLYDAGRPSHSHLERAGAQKMSVLSSGLEVISPPHPGAPKLDLHNRARTQFQFNVFSSDRAPLCRGSLAGSRPRSVWCEIPPPLILKSGSTVASNDGVIILRDRSNDLESLCGDVEGVSLDLAQGGYRDTSTRG